MDKSEAKSRRSIFEKSGVFSEASGGYKYKDSLQNPSRVALEDET
jgi:hypothetical protein